MSPSRLACPPVYLSSTAPAAVQPTARSSKQQREQLLVPGHFAIELSADGGAPPWK